MAITVEDGTGLANANTYATWAELGTYFTARGIVTTGKTQSQWEGYLVQATDYIDRHWQFQGIRLTATQALLWPRSYIYDDRGTAITGLPLPVKNAAIEYAYQLSLGNTLFLNPTVDASGARVISERKVVGPIEKSVTFASSGSLSTYREFPAGDSLLWPFSIGGASAVRA
jgi:hypothetical protein